MGYRIRIKETGEMQCVGRICIPCKKVTTDKDMEKWYSWDDVELVSSINNVIGSLFDVEVKED